MGFSRARFLAALAAAPVLGAAPAVAQTPPPLRLAAVATESYAEPLYAADGGFFSRAGIDVEMQFFTTGGQITNALAGGALDAGIADSIQVGNAFNRGVPFAFFAGGMEYTSQASTTQLCVEKDGPIRGPKDLEGKTVGVNGLKSIAELSVREWLRTNGVDVSKVAFVEIPPSAALAALQRGTVAAMMISEPVLSTAGEDTRYLASAYDACAKNFYINCWFANRDWLAKNADLAHKLAQAIYDAARWANTHHAETAPILAKYAKLEPDKITKMQRAVYDTSLDPKKMQPVLDIAWRYHVLEKPLTAADLIVKV
jgi:NitT/TauT family transport system substrate-binding protein